MNEQEPRHTTDRDLEEALAYAARLRAAHPEENDRPTDGASNKPVAPHVRRTPDTTTPTNRTERFRPAQEITLPDDSRNSRTSAPAKEAAKPAPTKTLRSVAEKQPIAEPDTSEADTPADKQPAEGRFWRFLHRIIPVAGDPWWEVGRKLLFLVALIVLIGSSAMLLNESVILPKENADMQNELLNLFEQSRKGELTEAEAAYTGYPDGINTDFKKLYYQNHDVRGRLVYSPCGVDNMVMYSGDNVYYLNHDFYRNTNKHGSLFFDETNNLNSASANYKSLVIYGHNMASGQMFAGLNQLASSVDVMKRAGCSVTLETLFDTRQYKIFAVVLQDPNSDIAHYYSIQTTSFANNAEFMNYVRGLRARSLYDFNGVDVNESDNILIMYTCSPKSVCGMSEGRLAVVARQVRSGESATVDTSTITTNEDVIMPYAWYVQNKKTPHSFYSGGALPNSDTTTTSPDAPNTSDTPSGTDPVTPDQPVTPVDPSAPTNPPVTQPVTPVDPGRTDPTNPEPTAPTEPVPTDPSVPDVTDPSDSNVTDPSEPTEPVGPVDPVDPTEPTPNDTTAPSEPSDPTTPSEPTTPVDEPPVDTPVDEPIDAPAEA